MQISLLKKRILEICYKYQISHIGSFISAADIIEEIYNKKKEDDIFILSSGHAGLALYCVLEQKYGFNAEKLYKKHGLHPHRDLDDKIYCSTGSLGTGICWGVGEAIVNKNKDVYILISDGETFEGSIWESLSIIDEFNLSNVKVYVNINGYSAYKEMDKDKLINKLKAFLPSINIRLTDFSGIEFLHGILAHYKTINEQEYLSIK